MLQKNYLDKIAIGYFKRTKVAFTVSIIWFEGYKWTNFLDLCSHNAHAGKWRLFEAKIQPEANRLLAGFFRICNDIDQIR